jgi:hypothetical protein
MGIKMKLLRGALTLALVVLCSPSLAQTNPGTSPLSIVKGGTGQATAAAARASSGLNVERYTGHGDSNYTILSTDRTVGTTAAFTAARTWTLPAANSVNPGQTILVADYYGGVSGVYTLTIARAGSDTINGSTSAVIKSPYGRIELRSDGTSKWSSVASANGPKTPMDYGAACDGSTDDAVALQAWLDAIPTDGGGFIPPGLTCMHSAIIYPRSNTIINAYGATIKATSSSGSSNKGIFLTDATWAGTGPTNITIQGLTYDGNRTARGPTGIGFGGAAFYTINAQNIVFRDVTCQEAVNDCFYAGGVNSFTYNYILDRVYTYRAYRNGCSFVGVFGGSITNSTFQSSTGTSPQSGCDLEPDNTTYTNFGVFVSNNNFIGNAGDGLTVVGAGNDGNFQSGATMNHATGNGRYGYYTTTTSANFRWCAALGSGNTTGLQTGVTDKCL